MKWRLLIDKKPAGDYRDSWARAAQDAVEAGLAEWSGNYILHWNKCSGGSIERTRL